MKSRVLCCLAVVFYAHLVQAQFHPGNLAVLRVGDGNEILSSSGNEVFIDQYTSSGTWLNTVSIPTNGPKSLLISGKAASEGFINLSIDKHLLTLVGYGANLGFSGSLPDSASTTVPRVIGTIDYLGNYSFVLGTTAFFSSNNIRSGITDGTNNFWASGANSGLVYLGESFPPAVLQSVNTEVAAVFNGNLCFSSQKSSPVGIWGFAGTPTNTTTPAPIVACSGPASPSPYAFAISPDGHTLYVADDNSLQKGGGIQKYTNSGSWSLAYTLGTGAASTTGARGLTVNFTGAQPILYATTADAISNNLIRIVDTGPASAATVLATAGTNQLFRGVQFIPQGYRPKITGQPQNQTVPFGSSAFFSVTNSGTAPFAYQWLFDSSAISGQTNATLDFASATTNDSGNYQVVITNVWGASTSLVAVLTVGAEIPLPTIITNPISQIKNATGTVTFSVAATGTVSSYQWQQDDTNIIGATQAILILTNVLGADSGTYQVILSNSSGSVTSAPATLTVIDPYIVAQPTPQTYLPGATVTLSVQAVGTQPLHYQWRLNGTPLPGATADPLLITNLNSSNAGSYSVIVTDPAGSATSSNAAVLLALPQTTFFASNIAVLRSGDGAQILANSGNTLFLDQFTTNGAYVSTMNIPDAGTNALVTSGIAASEGYMTLSADGKSLVIAGYNTNRGVVSTSLGGTTSAAVPRAVATVNGNGAFALALASTLQYNTNHFRCAFSDGSGNFWGAGSYYGISYLGLKESASILQDALGNCRVLNMIDGNFLTFTTQTETPGVYIFETPSPTSPDAISLVIGTGSGSSPEDFAFAPGNAFAYIADDSAGGGIQRWQLAQGDWSLVYTLGSGARGVGVRSFTANFSGPFPVLYGITAETASNRLITITDTGANAAATTWSTAGANQLYRSVRFAPLVQPVPAILSVGGSLMLTVSGTTGFSYVIQSSTNLKQWVSVATNPVPFTFTPGLRSGSSAQFYRAVSGQ